MNKHYITEEVLRLVRLAADGDRGSRAAFCRRSGISPGSLSKILNGKQKFVYGDEWYRLCDAVPGIGGGVRVPAAAPVDLFPALLEEIIRLEIDPVSKDAVLRAIMDFKQKIAAGRP